MADNDKQQNFISDARQLATRYRDIVNELNALSEAYESLYVNILTEEDFTGENMAVIPYSPDTNPATRLASLVAVIGNMQTIVSTFDAGQDTNFERITQ